MSFRVPDRLSHVRFALTEALYFLWRGGMPRRILGGLLRSLLALVLLGHAALAVLILLTSAALSRWNPPVTALMVYRRLTTGQKIGATRFVPLRQIPRPARDMVVRLEDFHFYRHRGIDIGAIRDAYLINKSIGYVLYGGSTIPQQLARNLFLTPRKTYFRKYVEAFIAVEMDLILTKDRILELYLNNIEWGKGVFGIGAASLHSYGMRVGSLSVDQQRRLITILTNPLRYDVRTFMRSRQMAARYRYLVSRYADPGDTRTASPPPDQQPAASPQPVPAQPTEPQPSTVPAPAS
jgi:monofunctional biosynthetic peptidoglycan transglycosylase